MGTDCEEGVKHMLEVDFGVKSLKSLLRNKEADGMERKSG